MRKILALGCCFALIISCKKSDPAPLGAQTQAKLLAGESGKSKSWKVVSITAQTGSSPAQTYTLNGCFTDNLYTFTNNVSQDYEATEGPSKCSTSSPDSIEKGTWSFTLDGVVLNVGVDQISSYNGLFSPDAVIIVTDSNNNEFPLTLTYPYPAAVTKLTADQMILEMNNVFSSTATKYTITFIAS